MPTVDASTNPESGLNRRRFLGGVLGGTVAWVAAACGWGSETPTPTVAPTVGPTPTTTPVAQSSLIPTPAASIKTYMPQIAKNSNQEVAILSPTEEPTAKPTATKKPKKTATPEPTPLPPTTPFPPGPPSKLGVVVARNDPQLFDLLATKGLTVVSTLELDPNFAAQIKQISPKTLLIGRLPDTKFDQLDLSTLSDPVGAARAFVEQLMPVAGDEQRRAYFDAWQAYNEPVANTADEMQRLADFEAERTRLLSAEGIRSVIGNFGTGHPTEMSQWEQFVPALQAAQEHNGWLGLHEYSAPTIYFSSSRGDTGNHPDVTPEDTGWLTLRYRHVYNEILKPKGLAIPLVFTELGVDGYVKNNRPGPEDARGWQDFQDYWAQNGYGLWGPGAYIEQLVWFDQAMRQDEYVLGGCIFALAASARWQSYDILGPAADILKQYLSVHAPA
ncbi:MAG: hypothetical protein NT075_05830 [Chloroflexi bacterium]|nr:hypothetical protein [Chloroflexota bacterium]